VANTKKTKGKLEIKDTVREPAPIRKEIRGIVFLLMTLILGISLFSFQPSDVVFSINPEGAENAQNLFGTVGAHLSGWIFHVIGFSSFWLVVVFFVMAVLSFRGKHFLPPIKSILAILFLVISFAGFIGLQINGEIGGMVNPGGLVGKFLADFMEKYFNRFGSLVFLLTVFIISLMICTHISFGWLFSRVYLWIMATARRVKELHTKRKEHNRKKRVRNAVIKKETHRIKRKVSIVEPKKKKSFKKLEQESFPFMENAAGYKLPSLNLLEDHSQDEDLVIQRDSLEMNARRLEKKLADFGVEGEVLEISPGPVITMYEFKPAPGIKISKVAGLADDLTLALRAPSVRIVAPLPGKAAIGIEIANNKRNNVYLKDVLASDSFKDSKIKLPLALGKDITGETVVADLIAMPHLLVAGATGTGKSVSLNAMINSLLFKVSPDNVRLLMIDPKRIELSVYKDIPHLLYPVVTEPSEATRALRWAVQEMERRYRLLDDRGVRNIETYNRKILKQKKVSETNEDGSVNKPLPYIILVIDELADLMMISSRDVEESITRLAQMARAAGIHLIIATQRPSVDVLTGIIKANFPTRISFQVSSKVDSRTILDAIGAEHLLGNGDMLFMPPGVGRITRIHGAFISDDEVKDVADFVRGQMQPEYDSGMLEKISVEMDEEGMEIEHDEKYDQAVEVVCQSGHASISSLQRKLRVGYNRAARMIEIMEKEGIVGPSDGVKGREVYGRKM